MSGGALTEKRFKLLLDLLNNRWAHFFWGYFSVSICPQINGANRASLPLHHSAQYRRQNAVSQLHRRAWTDKRRRRKRLVQYISQRDVQGRRIFAICKLYRALRRSRFSGDPQTRCTSSSVGSAPWRTADRGRLSQSRKNPRACADQEQRNPRARVPVAEIICRTGQAPVPNGLLHARQREIIAHERKPRTSLGLCIFVRCVNARCRPVGTTENTNTSLIHFAMQCIDPFADRDIRAVTVQAVNVQIVRLQPVEGLIKLTRDGIGCAVRGCAPFPRMTTSSRIPRAFIHAPRTFSLMPPL